MHPLLAGTLEYVGISEADARSIFTKSGHAWVDLDNHVTAVAVIDQLVRHFGQVYRESADEKLREAALRIASTCHYRAHPESTVSQVLVAVGEPEEDHRQLGGSELVRKEAFTSRRRVSFDAGDDPEILDAAVEPLVPPADRPKPQNRADERPAQETRLTPPERLAGYAGTPHHVEEDGALWPDRPPRSADANRRQARASSGVRPKPPPSDDSLLSVRRLVVDGANMSLTPPLRGTAFDLESGLKAMTDALPHAKVIAVVLNTGWHRRRLRSDDQSEVALLERKLASGEWTLSLSGEEGKDDGSILDLARDENATVVSRDGYKEFQARHPWIRDRGRLLGCQYFAEPDRWQFRLRTPPAPRF